MWLLVLGLIVFLGIHSVRIVAPDWRDAQLATRGEGPWKGIYSLVSLVGLVLIVIGYGQARGDAGDLFDPPEWGRSLALALMPISLILLMASNFPPGYIKKAVKHPLLIAVLLWSGSHLLANGDTASAWLFGAFLVWGIVDLISASRRPSVPNTTTLIWPDLVALALGLILTWLFTIWLHGWLMGVPLV